MRKTFISLMAVGALLAVAGCGGGSSNDTLSYSDFGSQADQICKDGTDAVNKLPKSANGSDFADAIQPYVDKIKALKAPDELKSAQDDFVSISEEQAAAGRAGDFKKVQSLGAASDAAGSKMGAPACASTGG
jgi:hypothetical protein